MHTDKKITITVHGDEQDRKTALVGLLKTALESRVDTRELVDALTREELTLLAQRVHGAIYRELGTAKVRVW